MPTARIYYRIATRIVQITPVSSGGADDGRFTPFARGNAELPDEPARKAAVRGIAGPFRDRGDRLYRIAKVTRGELPPRLIQQIAERRVFFVEHAL